MKYLNFLKIKILDNSFITVLTKYNIFKVSCFFADLTFQLNILSLKLQSRGQNICQFYSNIEGFRENLEIFTKALENNNSTYFPYML